VSWVCPEAGAWGWGVGQGHLCGYCGGRGVGCVMKGGGTHGRPGGREGGLSSAFRMPHTA